jgi:L-fuculose-phosphate aldolase
MRALGSAGLNRGTAGNVSLRTAEGFLVTPSAIKPDVLAPSDIVRLDAAGAVVGGTREPSSEWRFHRDIYAARPDAHAVVHVHSPHATALACQRRDIPPFHYMVAKAGGDSVRCARYATFGSQALSDAAVEALAGRRACLLANHGMITLGAGLEAAIDLAVEVEELARQYVLALMCGTPVLLGADEMREVLERFENYGAANGKD